MKNDPQISVVVAARDASATVGKAVASALRQPETREVIVVDDGSIDATADAASGADDGSDRVRVLRQTPSLGPSAPRATGLIAGRPWGADRGPRRRRPPGRRPLHPHAGGRDGLGPAGRRHPPSRPPPRRTRRLRRCSTCPTGRRAPWTRQCSSAEILADPRRPRRELGFLKPLMKRRFLADHGLAYDESVRLGEDFVFYTQALLRGARFLLVPACGYIRRRSRRLAEQPAWASRNWPALVAADTAADRRGARDRAGGGRGPRGPTLVRGDPASSSTTGCCWTPGRAVTGRKRSGGCCARRRRRPTFWARRSRRGCSGVGARRRPPCEGDRLERRAGRQRRHRQPQRRPLSRGRGAVGAAADPRSPGSDRRRRMARPTPASRSPRRSRGRTTACSVVARLSRTRGQRRRATRGSPGRPAAGWRSWTATT